MLEYNPAFTPWKDEVHLDHLSASSVGGFQTCGLSWKLSHLDKVAKIGTASWFAFGSAYHRGLEPWWLGKSPQFADAWGSYRKSKVEYYGRGSWESMYSMGMKMTSATKAVTEGKFVPISVLDKKERIEKTEDVDLGFVVVRRRIDVILEATRLPVLDVTKGDVVEFVGKVLVDVKTAGRQYDHRRVLTSGQLKTYAIPNHGEVFGDKLSAYIITTKTANPVVQIIGKRYDKDEIKEQIKTIKQVADQIRNGVFTRREGDHCDRCDFFDLCYKTPGWEKRYNIRRDRPRDKSIDSSAAEKK